MHTALRVQQGALSRRTTLLHKAWMDYQKVSGCGSLKVCKVNALSVWSQRGKKSSIHKEGKTGFALKRISVENV